MKTTGTYKGKSNKLGGGGRFAQTVDALKGKVKNPKAVAAMIGRKKYGAKKMAAMAKAGKKHEAKESKGKEKREEAGAKIEARKKKLGRSYL